MTMLRKYGDLLIFAPAVFMLALVLMFMPSRHVEAQSGGTPCDQVIAVSDAAASSQTLVSAVPGAVVYVCAYDISGDTAATTLTWKSGTTALSGAELVAANGHYTAGDGTGILLSTSTGSSLVISAATGAVAGWVKVGQH